MFSLILCQKSGKMHGHLEITKTSVTANLIAALWYHFSVFKHWETVTDLLCTETMFLYLLFHCCHEASAPIMSRSIAFAVTLICLT